MKLFEKKLNSRTVFDGKILKLQVDEVELPDGKKSVRECVRHSGGAAVLLVNENKVLLVKQFRYLYGKAVYEIPAGKLNAREATSVAAARELEEETGYRADLKPFLKLYPSPGYTDEVIHIFYAEKFSFVGQRLDDGEFLNCEFVPLDKAAAMVEGNEICDAKTVAAIYKFLSMKNSL